MEGVTEGRIVHYVLPNSEHRPAIIVNSWPHISEYVATGKVNLTVFPDGSNDRNSGLGITADGMLGWATSVPYSEEKVPGTWHWIEKA